MHKKNLTQASLSSIFLTLSLSLFLPLLLSLSLHVFLSVTLSSVVQLYHSTILIVLVCDSHPWHSSVIATKDCILIGALFLGNESWQRWIFNDTFYNVFTKHKPSNVYISILQGICQSCKPYHKAANFLSSMHADARLANVAEYPHLMRSLYIPSSLSLSLLVSSGTCLCLCCQLYIGVFVCMRVCECVYDSMACQKCAQLTWVLSIYVILMERVAYQKEREEKTKRGINRAERERERKRDWNVSSHSHASFFICYFILLFSASRPIFIKDEMQHKNKNKNNNNTKILSDQLRAAQLKTPSIGAYHTRFMYMRQARACPIHARIIVSHFSHALSPPLAL